jgi:hypothetical protein
VVHAGTKSKYTKANGTWKDKEKYTRYNSTCDIAFRCKAKTFDENIRIAS